MISFLGYSGSDFMPLPKGANGYKKMYRLEGAPISILSDGNENMGIHVIISGTAIPDLMEHFKASIMQDPPFGKDVIGLSDFDNTVMIEFLQQVRSMGWLTRFDLAVDREGTSDPWVRWEIELKNERANIAADFLIRKKQLGEIIMEILNNYVRVIVHDDSNRSRCSAHPV